MAVNDAALKCVGNRLYFRRPLALLPPCTKPRRGSHQTSYQRGRDLSLFRISEPDRCWICLSGDRLTREHRYKASDVRRMYGRDVMHIYEGGPSGSLRGIAQGPKSDALKFNQPICADCNSARTQSADRAYDALISRLEAGGGGDAGLASLDAAFTADDDAYWEVCRYFGKLLGSHLADMGAPIPVRLCNFVAGQSDENCIYVAIRDDPRAGQMRSGFDGVAFVTRQPEYVVVRVHSTLTVGLTQFLFGMHLTVDEIDELPKRYPDFAERAETQARSVTVSDLDGPEFSNLGLLRHEEPMTALRKCVAALKALRSALLRRSR